MYLYYTGTENVQENFISFEQETLVLISFYTEQYVEDLNTTQGFQTEGKNLKTLEIQFTICLKSLYEELQPRLFSENCSRHKTRLNW